MSQDQIRAEKVLNFPNNVNYKAKMSVDVCMSIESALGQGLMQIATKLSDAGITLHEVITIITLAIRGGGNDVKESDVKNIINNQIGIAEGYKICGELLTLSLSTGDKLDQKKSEV